MRAAVSLSPSVPFLRSRSLSWLVQPTALLLLSVAALLLLAPPHGEFPIDDDWIYSRMVQELAERGQFELPAWTSHALIFQIYWAYAFTWIFGFSHQVLRASTIVVAAAGLLGCYALLRELLDDRRALIGALFLLFNPIFVFLTYSFMSDMHFLTLSLWSMACSVKGLRPGRRGTLWLAAGGVAAAIAYVVRPLAATLPLAVLCALWLRDGRSVLRRPLALAAVAVPLLPAFLYGAYLDSFRGNIKNEPLVWSLDYWRQVGAQQALAEQVDRLTGVAATLGLFVLPLLICLLLDREALGRLYARKWLVGVLLLLTAATFAARTAVYGRTALFPQLVLTILTPRGFSAFRYLGTLPDPILSDSALEVLTVASWLGAGLLVLALGTLPTPRRASPASVIPLLFGIGVLAQSLFYYVYFDRYLLPILPTTLLVALLALRSARLRIGLAITGLLLTAVWSITWERDYLERREALWQAADKLVQQGVPPVEIYGGYEWNGWYRASEAYPIAAQQSEELGGGQLFEKLVLDIINSDDVRWGVAFAQPRRTPTGRVLLTVPYGRGRQVVGLQRY